MRTLSRQLLMSFEERKRSGSYYTPDATVTSLVRWAIRSNRDRMLDPSCGDGRFLCLHRNSAGVEQDPPAAAVAMQRAPWAMIHEGDFFKWAAETRERFDCAAGNPPFIRYQRFNGAAREGALRLCGALGAKFSSLTSSWAPFMVATASLLRAGGRLSFVVPAEIGHAPYAVPLLQYLAKHFEKVQVVAVREKIFPELSEDCWLLYAEGFGGCTERFHLSALHEFRGMEAPPTQATTVTLKEWQAWNFRLRPFLMPPAAMSLYRELAGAKQTARLGDVAKVGIGYVTGANDFFHLRPSQIEKLGIPRDILHASVRNGKALAGEAVTVPVVERWLKDDEPVMLLRLSKDEKPPKQVQRYLDTDAGREARETYKCRNRDPWYVVPDVTVPDAFLAYMSGGAPSLVQNRAECVCTNSIHAVHLNGNLGMAEILRRWKDPLTELSCEVEGHPLGGGMLKVEPREATRLLLAKRAESRVDDLTIAVGIEEMRRWRHCG